MKAVGAYFQSGTTLAPAGEALKVMRVMTLLRLKATQNTSGRKLLPCDMNIVAEPLRPLPVNSVPVGRPQHDRQP